MKLVFAIAKNTATLIFLSVILTLNHKHQAQAHHLLAFNQLIANAQGIPASKQIVAIRDLQPGKIQTISGMVAALCDDEFILRDDTSPIVVKVDLEGNNIKLFQGEKLSVIGIYRNDELEAFQIKRANGELIKLNAAEEELL